MTDSRLSINNLCVDYPEARVVNNVSFTLGNERLALVGESGSGKSMTARALMGLVRKPGVVTADTLNILGRDALTLNARGWQQLRGNDIAMVLQDPRYALNPVKTVKAQLEEALTLHQRLNRREKEEKINTAIQAVGLNTRVLQSYPRELSGGMGQRVMIAIALINDPRVLIADEPTTALDVTIQTQIMDLMRQMNKKTNTAILLISHDLGVVSRLCSRVYIMYAGRIVESGPVDEILTNPLHPYTKGLVEAIPDITKRGKPLKAIPGSVPGLYARNNTGCGFAERCEYCTNKCQKEVPPLVQEDGRAVACWNKNFDSGRGNTHD